MRRVCKEVRVGKVCIGGQNPVIVQSMLNVPVEDIEGNVRQAVRLEKSGCGIIRVTAPHPENAAVVEALKKAVGMPVVADIHFDYKAALACVAAGADKIRINPGNIGEEDHVKAVADACRLHHVPIRIGVNAGSLEKDILAKYGAPVPEALVESAMHNIELLEKYDFNDIVISIKSSHVPSMVKAYQILACMCDYPFHIGVTEAGTYRAGLVKSAVGIGSLLLAGIGDTLRVSLTDDPEKEVQAGYDILRACGHPVAGPELISCPTCGRTQIDLVSLAKQVEARLQDCHKNIKVAVMGCVVNGPGEAREADIGIAGGKDCAVLFVKGQQVRTLRGDIVGQLMEEIDRL